MSTTIAPTIEPALTSRLGQLAVSWAVIEAWLSHLLATLVNADLGAMSVITNDLSGGMIIEHIKTILSVHEPKDSSLAVIRELVEAANDIRGERNLLIHGLWDPTHCEPGTCLVQNSGWKRVEITREWLVTTADLDQLISDCDSWIMDFVKLGIQFNFPRKRGETKSIFLD